jgi:hypothetical protein
MSRFAAAGANAALAADNALTCLFTAIGSALASVGIEIGLFFFWTGLFGSTFCSSRSEARMEPGPLIDFRM